MDYFENFPMSDNVVRSRELAHQIAAQNHNRYVEPIHFIYAMYNIDCVCSQILHEEGLMPVAIVSEIGKLEKVDTLSEPEESNETKLMFDDARRIALICKKDCIYTEHLLLASVFYKNSSMYKFLSRNISLQSMLNNLDRSMNINNILDNIKNIPSAGSGRRPRFQAVVGVPAPSGVERPRRGLHPEGARRQDRPHHRS